MEAEKMRVTLDQLLSWLAPAGESGTSSSVPAPDRAPSDEPRWEGVSLSFTLKTPAGAVEIAARADAVTLFQGTYCIEEALVSDAWYQTSPEVREAAEIRGKILALALASARNLPRVGLVLALYGGGDTRRETAFYEKDELRDEVARILAPVLPLLPALAEQPRVPVTFPYDRLREGQRELMDEVWNAVKTGRRLYACAPTGIGKTAAVLYPALKALEKGRAEKLFYASPKNTLKAQAAEAVARMQGDGSLHVLTLAAKMSLCPLGLEECQGRDCPYLEDFSRRAAPAVSGLFEAGFVGPDELRAAGEKYTLCPFELSLKAADFSRVIIGDYNHAFDPRFRVGQEGKDHILLVDEAHNLPGRIRESFTEALTPADLDPFYREDNLPGQMLREHFQPMAEQFAIRRRAYQEDKKDFSFEKPEEMEKIAAALLPKLRFVLGDGFGALPEAFRNRVRLLYRKVKKYTELGKDFGEDYAEIRLPDGGSGIHLLDPRNKIRAAAEKWRTAVFFSATLAPRDYFFSVLAGEEGDRFLDLPSPFPKENLFCGIVPVDVSFSRRHETARELCGVIRAATRARPGNYMVFLPSFEYLDLVSQEYKRRYMDDQLLIQKRFMRREERTRFLETFRQTRAGVLLGFCVMGGVFAEGVDLKGESLVGEIVVGVGFPPPSAEGEAESALYYKRDMDGRNFAYTLPGWSRVLQAAGRVIRDEEDRGVLILCDQRYLREDARALFPEYWDEVRVYETERQLAAALDRFWQN
ncbi:MAG: ATP-dependent DNA helicase [Clostridia bacterium]|nr:ATP-dependent DNA helicase [Clostridia bacterium]